MFQICACFIIHAQYYELLLLYYKFLQNHELYNLSRDELGKLLKIPFTKEPCGDLVGYHSFTQNDIRFIVIDTYDVAIMQRCPETSNKRKQAEDILSMNNHNFAADESKLNSPEGLTGVEKRFVAFNGGIDVVQLAWLRQTLQEAKNMGQRAIILSHQPIHPKSSSPVCLIWNYEEVLNILRDYRSTVIASFCGHAHRGGYHRDTKSGIHFRVIEAVLESPDPIKTYGIVDVHSDRLELRGNGACISASYDFSHMNREATC